MSGGVDSAVTAMLLKDQGFDVFGLHMRLLPDVEPDHLEQNDLHRIAEFLDIPVREISLVDQFRTHVIGPFIDDYTHNRTPNPCVECNRYLKFGMLLEMAFQHGAQKLATGHYARIHRNESGRFAIRRGIDPQKNQSYYLYGLNQDSLSHILFPLGDYTKSEVRKIARDRGLPVADKDESQEICFITDNDYRRYLRDAGVRFRQGHFVNSDGKILGEHSGQELYTVGQRKGLGISHSEPLYVIRLLDNGDILVGEKRETMTDSFRVIRPSFQMLDPDQLSGEGINCSVQIRYRSLPVDANVRIDPELILKGIPNNPEDRVLRITTHQPVQSPTPGQSAVFYGTLAGERSSIILGGGIIQI